MSKFRILLVSLLILGGAEVGSAHQECLSVSSPLRAEEIEALLHSGSLDLIAWGAFLAGQSSDDGLVTTMLQLMERGVTAPARAEPYRGPYSSCMQSATPEVAMLEILDTLIKRREIVPSEAISAVAAAYTAQAFVLASRLPPERATNLFENWYYAAGSDDYANGGRNQGKLVILARLSAMMLAKSPPPGFAAHLLTSSEERIVVSVTSESSRYLDGSVRNGPAGTCKDTPNFALPEHFPPIVQYALEENSPEKSLDFEPDHILIVSGGDRITYRSAPIGITMNSCYRIHALNPETRRRLIAEMLDIRDEQFPWKARIRLTIPWENKSQFEEKLRAIAAAEEEKLRLTTEAMYGKGFLTTEEKTSTRPQLKIFAYDDRLAPGNGQRASGGPLPELKFRDVRISFELPPWIPTSGRD